ncbi:hypothetical protein QFZ68_000514 [Streptomyces sp. V1I6]|nr:hypothetical protein [Streptomyces sp. V1I6]
MPPGYPPPRATCPTCRTRPGRASGGQRPPDPVRQEPGGLVEVHVVDAGEPAPRDTDDRTEGQGFDQRQRQRGQFARLDTGLDPLGDGRQPCLLGVAELVSPGGACAGPGTEDGPRPGAGDGPEARTWVATRSRRRTRSPRPGRSPWPGPVRNDRSGGLSAAAVPACSSPWCPSSSWAVRPSPSSTCPTPPRRRPRRRPLRPHRSPRRPTRRRRRRAGALRMRRPPRSRRPRTSPSRPSRARSREGRSGHGPPLPGAPGPAHRTARAAAVKSARPGGATGRHRPSRPAGAVVSGAGRSGPGTRCGIAHRCAAGRGAWRSSSSPRWPGRRAASCRCVRPG